MKLSFSLSSSKNTPKPSRSTFNSSQDQHDESSKKEFLTEFDPSKTLADSTSANPIVIPPIPNEWKPQSKANNVDSPVKSDAFKADTVDSNITYGLNLRAKKVSGSGSDTDTEPKIESLSSIERLMLKKLRSDLERLPEDRGLEEFDDVPVEDFAPAYLKGYGWYEGRGIGKNAEEDVKVVQFTKRTAKEGLGFVRTNDSDHRGRR